MRRFACCFMCLAVLISSAAAQTPVPHYYPDPFDWQRRTPQQARLDAAALDAAIRFAVAIAARERYPGNPD